MVEKDIEVCEGACVDENTFSEFVGIEPLRLCWMYVRDFVSFLLSHSSELLIRWMRQLHG